MSMAFGIIGFLGLIVCIIWLIVSAIRKKSKKPCLITLLASIIVFGIGMATTPSTEKVDATQASNKSAISAQSSANGMSSTQPEKSSSAPSDESQKAYRVGDTVVVDSPVGKYSVTIDSVKSIKERNEFADSQPKQVIMVNYSYSNITCTQDITYSYVYFHVYDSTGKLLETYPATVKDPANISKGKHHSASAAFGLDGSGKQVQIELYDIFDPSKHIAAYQTDVK